MTISHDVDAAKMESCVLKLKGRQWQGLDKETQNKLIELCVAYWRARGFPYYNLCKTEIIREYQQLMNVHESSMFLEDEIQRSMVGLRLANYFHPQMWSVRVKGSGYSPMERFLDDKVLPKLIRRAFNLWPARYGANASNLRGILKTYSNTASVSNFRPTVAKAIYEKFSQDGDSILDFSTGYGGRLLGCLPLRRYFVGIDPCEAQVVGCERMQAVLRSLINTQAQVQINKGCAEDVLPTLDANSFSLVFSSPPYFDNELYSEESTQSYIKFPSYEAWIEGFLRPVVEESYRLLKPGGHFIVNVADVNGYKLTENFVQVTEAYFEPVTTLKMRLGFMPYLRHLTSNKAFKYEPIFVYRKV